MYIKDRTKTIIFQLAGILKPLAVSLVLVAFLRVTGLMSSVSISHWALLQTGLKDATEENPLIGEDFNYQFTIKDLDGNKFSFDQYKGKVIFLNVWAAWCGPCRAEMPGIQKLYNKMDKEKVTFIMLSIDKDADLAKVVDYVKKKEFTFRTYQPSGYLPQQLKVPFIPTTFIISKEGKIVKKEVGTTNFNKPKFQKFLEELSQQQVSKIQ